MEPMLYLIFTIETPVLLHIKAGSAILKNISATLKHF